MLDDDRTITNVINDEATAEISLQSLVLANSLDRRTSPRIRYHLEYFEPLPSLKISSQYLLPIDISKGGFALDPDLTPFEVSVNDEVRVEVSWDNLVFERLSKAVNCSDMYRFKWTEEFPELETFLKQFYTPALVGEKLTLIRNNLNGVEIRAEEIWLGPSNEFLVFHREPEAKDPTSADMRLGDKEVSIKLSPFSLHSKGDKITALELAQWIVLLNQKSSPSTHLLGVLQNFYPLYFSLLKSGNQ